MTSRFAERRARPFRRQGRAAVVVAVAAGLAGCGGSAAEEARRLQARSVLDGLSPIPRYAVTAAHMSRTPPASVERAFLQHWSKMQVRPGPTAARSFEPGLRRVVGEDLLALALARQGGAYRSSRPRIISARRDEDEALVVYDRIDADATARESMTFARDRAGTWLIRHDPLLDQALAEAAEQRAQRALDPLAQRLLPAAIRAGTTARGLQRRYLAQLERRATRATP